MTPTFGLSRRSFAVLRLIRRRHGLGLVAPTIAEISRDCGVAHGTAKNVLDRLVQRGHVIRLARRARAIEPARPVTVQHFIMQRECGESQLVPLHEVGGIVPPGDGVSAPAPSTTAAGGAVMAAPAAGFSGGA